MNDNSAHMSNNPSDVTSATPKQVIPNASYVDDYQPPASQGMVSEPENKEVVNNVKPEPAASTPVNEPVSFDDLIKASVSTPPTSQPKPVQEVRRSVEAKDEVTSKVTHDSTPESLDKPTTSETLEDQNIFSMLGVDDGTEELKENFLNELQQVIWDDFLENDVDLLITSDEKVKFDEIMAKKDKTDAGVANKEADDKIQDALVAYLETLIPDLEDIMLEKALDLKSDLYAERIIGMKEYHANNSENLAIVNSAEKMMHEDKWHSSAQLLNKIATE